MGAFSATTTFTPAATAHGAADVNGAAAQFVSIAPRSGHIMITSATLLIPDATVKATAWRLHLYNITPPSAIADDGVWDIAATAADRAAYLGYVDLGTAIDVGATQYVQTDGINKQLMTASTSLFAYLSNLSAITPAAVAHSVTLFAVAM